MRLNLLAIGSFAAAAIVGATAMLSAQTTAPPGDAKHGQQVFLADGCYLCHNIQGQASGTRRAGNPGPNIAPAPIPFAAYAKQVRTPRGTMPPYDAKILSDKDLADIYAYLQSQPAAKDPRSIALLNVVHTGSAGNTPYGAVIFFNSCATCHGATGQGGGAGPSLKNESSKKDAVAVAAFVKNPPGAMPKLYPGLLSDSDVTAVASYVETLK